MYVCICNQVTEKQVKSAINAGAASLRDLHNELGVASQCGQCSGCAKKLLEKHDDKQRSVTDSVNVFPLFPYSPLTNG